MFNHLVGPVDVPASMVLIAMFAAFTIICATFIAMFRTKTEEEHKFQLANLAARAEEQIRIKTAELAHEREMASIASKRDVEFRRIDTGLIELQAVNKRRDGTDDVS